MKTKYTNCNDCPCLNTDYESAAYCNLGFETDLAWINKITLKIVEDTKEIRSHQIDFKLINASFNCKLERIIFDGKCFIPVSEDIK